MSKQDVFHPRFSVRNAFEDGEIDVSQGNYATAGRNNGEIDASQGNYATEAGRSRQQQRGPNCPVTQPPSAVMNHRNIRVPAQTNNRVTNNRSTVNPQRQVVQQAVNPQATTNNVKRGGQCGIQQANASNNQPTITRQIVQSSVPVQAAVVTNRVSNLAQVDAIARNVVNPSNISTPTPVNRQYWMSTNRVDRRNRMSAQPVIQASHDPNHRVSPQADGSWTSSSSSSYTLENSEHSKHSRHSEHSRHSRDSASDHHSRNDQHLHHSDHSRSNHHSHHDSSNSHSDAHHSDGHNSDHSHRPHDSSNSHSHHSHRPHDSSSSSSSSSLPRQYRNPQMQQPSQQQVEKVRFQAKPADTNKALVRVKDTSTPTDRNYWKSSNRVDQPAQPEQYETQAPLQLYSVLDSNDQKSQQQKNAQREVDNQRRLRGKDRDPLILNSQFKIQVSQEQLASDGSFTIDLTDPNNVIEEVVVDDVLAAQTQVQAAVIPFQGQRPQHPVNPVYGEDVARADDRRKYWGNKTAVYSNNRYSSKNF